MLARGDLVPHFDVALLDGRRADYRRIWQRHNLVLITVTAADRAAPALARLERLLPELTRHDTAAVLTLDAVPGLPATGLLIADGWGEITYARSGGTLADLPDPDEILDWLRFTRMRCPECEGEWR